MWLVEENTNHGVNRIKYFDLIRYNTFLVDDYPLRYYYFTSISEFYD